jgi:integrase
MDDDRGALVWLVMTTGMRRGELCGPRFSRLDLDKRSSTCGATGSAARRRTRRPTRPAASRWTARPWFSSASTENRVANRVRTLGQKFTDDLFVFSGTRSPDRKAPYSPNAATQRYKDMADRLDIDTHLHTLRHYSATELPTAGVDLRTVAGRLGSGGGGATTLLYAAFVAASDRKAAEILGSRMPKLPQGLA